MPVPTLCRICLTIKEECEIVWRIGNIPPTQFIKEIFQIEVEPELCIMCKRCEKELSNFSIFYKMVKDAQQKNICTLEGMKLKQEKMVIKQEALQQTNKRNEQHIKEEKPDSENVTFDMGFEYMDADKYESIDSGEVIDVDSQVSDVFKITISTNVDKKVTTNTGGNIDTNMRPFDVKKEALDALSRHKQASKTFLSKYSLDQVYENDKWLINEEQKKEIVSWFVDMKCNFAVCSELTEFESLSGLEQHAMSIHESYPKLFCCDDFYTTYSTLETHVLNKHLLKNKKIINIYIPCDVCGKSVRKFNMKYHLYRHLPNDKRNIQCDQCDARFITKSKLKNHLESFHSNESVPCDICGRTYKNKISLQVHKLSHTKQNFHLCPECGKKIVSKANFKDHMEEHYVKDVKVKCEICSKVVKRMYLPRHMRAHNPATLKQCPHCPYKTSYHLNAHIRKVHEKVKPHACSVCPKKFVTKKRLEDHVSSRHTGIPRYNCPFCDKTFMCSGNYFTHQKRMHPKELEEKKLKMAEKNDNLPVGKLINRMPILEGEASVKLENKLNSTKTYRVCDTMEPHIMSTSSDKA